MDDIVHMVAERTGIPEDTARKAVEIVINALKERLPAPIAAQIDTVVSGSGGIDAGGIAKGLGGMLGKR